ncbi:MAG: hypothetical protein KDD10_30230, partial [Phaeodactylibacter sp.]|nr:hypothetical protein [Phaeodactylibacter sp.]
MNLKLPGIPERGLIEFHELIRGSDVGWRLRLAHYWTKWFWTQRALSPTQRYAKFSVDNPAYVW